MTETKAAYLTRAGAAEYLACSISTINRLRKSGALPSHEISGVGRRYAVADLEAHAQGTWRCQWHAGCEAEATAMRPQPCFGEAYPVCAYHMIQEG